jgi:hypothetical protein
VSLLHIYGIYAIAEYNRHTYVYQTQITAYVQ